MLMANWSKVLSIIPANDTKPGEIVAISAALLGDDPTDAARGVQAFGVEHRVRVPAIKPLEPSAPDASPRRVAGPARSGDRRDRSQRDHGGSARAVRRAESRTRPELHRVVLALMEVEPSPRLLGLLVLAKVARPGRDGGGAQPARVRLGGSAGRRRDCARKSRRRWPGLRWRRTSSPGSPVIEVVRPGAGGPRLQRDHDSVRRPVARERRGCGYRNRAGRPAHPGRPAAIRA